MRARKAGWGAFYRRGEMVEEGGTARLRALQLVNGSGTPRVRPALLAGERERRGGQGGGTAAQAGMGWGRASGRKRGR